MSRILATAEAASPDDFVAGEMLVRFESGYTDAEQSAAIEDLGGVVVRRFDSIDTVQVTVGEPAGEIVSDIQRFTANPAVPKTVRFRV